MTTQRRMSLPLRVLSHRTLTLTSLPTKPPPRHLHPLLFPPLGLFHNSASTRGKPLPPLPPLNESEITESFIKGTGPGGQVINKTSSCVQLKHHPTGIVVKNQSTRSRAQNRTIARRILREKLEELELGEKSRVRVKEARERRKKESGGKKRRRKYRALAEGKEGGREVEEGEEGIVGEEGGAMSGAKEGEGEVQNESQSRRGVETGGQGSRRVIEAGASLEELKADTKITEGNGKG
ncbi:RF-1 domain-containing protein 2 [Elsinoe fawcettii]|nr:RF-1 domain-containing protein 2 [Elsinoe fawcettii]